MNNLVIKTIIDQNRPDAASAFLANISGLSKAKIKDAMNKGAVWKKTGRVS